MGYEVHFKGGKLDILSTVSMNYIARGLSTPEEVANWLIEYLRTHEPEKPMTLERKHELYAIWHRVAVKELVRAGKLIEKTEKELDEQMNDEIMASSAYTTLAHTLNRLGFDAEAKMIAKIGQEEDEHRRILLRVKESIEWRSPAYHRVYASSGGGKKVLPFR